MLHVKTRETLNMIVKAEERTKDVESTKVVVNEATVRIETVNASP